VTTYVVDITAPANTPADAPVTKEIEIEEGTIAKVMILIPAGHHCLAGLQIFYGIDQFFPKRTGEWLRGEDESLTFEEYWEPPEKPYKITLKAMNEDEVWEHTFYVRFVVLPRELANLADAIRALATRIAQAFARMFGWV